MDNHKPVNPADSGQPATSGVSGRSGDASRRMLAESVAEAAEWVLNGIHGISRNGEDWPVTYEEERDSLDALKAALAAWKDSNK